MGTKFCLPQPLVGGLGVCLMVSPVLFLLSCLGMVGCHGHSLASLLLLDTLADPQKPSDDQDFMRPF